MSKFHRFVDFFRTKRCLKRARAINYRDAVHCCRKNSDGIHAASLPHSFKFFYKNVAFFFVVSLELAHQASHRVLATRCESQNNVSDDLGVQQQMSYALAVN